MTVHDADLRAAAAPLGTAEPTEAGGLLTIDLAAVESNWKRLASLTVPVECAAVVKADGYGCGLEPVTRTLYRAGCRTFFVADVREGRNRRLRRRFHRGAGEPDRDRRRGLCRRHLALGRRRQRQAGGRGHCRQ